MHNKISIKLNLGGLQDHHWGLGVGDRQVCCNARLNVDNHLPDGILQHWAVLDPNSTSAHSRFWRRYFKGNCLLNLTNFGGSKLPKSTEGFRPKGEWTVDTNFGHNVGISNTALQELWSWPFRPSWLKMAKRGKICPNGAQTMVSGWTGTGKS